MSFTFLFFQTGDDDPCDTLANATASTSTANDTLANDDNAKCCSSLI